MKKWIVLIILILTIVIYFFSDFSSSTDDREINEESEAAKALPSSPSGTSSKDRDKSKDQLVKVNPPKSNLAILKPVSSMTEEEGQEAAQATLNAALAADSTIEDFVDRLKAHENDPTIDKQGDDSFGEVYSLSLKSAYPGTRNFYAQYESSPGGPPRARRISFELPPGLDNVKKAQAVLDSVPGLTKVVRQEDDFGRTQYDDGRHCWYKVMDEEWIAQDNPLHAYDKEDLGTVIVVCEEDIHPDMEGTVDGPHSHEEGEHDDHGHSD